MSVLDVVMERIGDLKNKISEKESSVASARDIYAARRIRNDICELRKLLEVNESMHMLLRKFH